MIGDLDRLPIGDVTQDLTALVSHLAVCDGSHVAQRSTPVQEIGGQVTAHEGTTLTPGHLLEGGNVGDWSGSADFTPPSLVDSGPLYAGANVTRISEILPAARVVSDLTP
jgi:hypothetical protein